MSHVQRQFKFLMKASDVCLKNKQTNKQTNQTKKQQPKTNKQPKSPAQSKADKNPVSHFSLFNCSLGLIFKCLTVV